MKKIHLLLILVLLFLCSIIFANPGIREKHKDFTKGGKALYTTNPNCYIYCHINAKIEKKKGNNVDMINKNKYCSGSGCHPLE